VNRLGIPIIEKPCGLARIHTAVAMAKSVEELETNTQEFMSKLSNNPDHVQSYFDHPALDDYKLD
jgi:hypothetical protein